MSNGLKHVKSASERTDDMKAKIGQKWTLCYHLCYQIGQKFVLPTPKKEAILRVKKLVTQKIKQF